MPYALKFGGTTMRGSPQTWTPKFKLFNCLKGGCSLAKYDIKKSHLIF